MPSGGRRPTRLLELGTYCGYSGLRMARVMPGGRAALLDRVQPGEREDRAPHLDPRRRRRPADGRSWARSATAARRSSGCRREHGFSEGALDFVFVDHDKSAYLPDLERILEQRWLHAGALVVADNVKVPGAPDYRAYMRSQEGRCWRTVEHDTHVEYQTLLKDLVLESEYLGEAA